MSCHQLLREKGYKLTPQRAAIIDALHGAEQHISAEDIYEQVASRFPEMNRSTVYRTLDLLRELGLTTEADLGEGKLCYHHAEKGGHHHLICQQCGKTVEINEEILEPIRATLTERYGFVPTMKHLPISGHCVNCQSPQK